MTPKFALSLSSRGIQLLHLSAENTWSSLGSVALDSSTLNEDLTALRAKAAQLETDDTRVALLIPEEQVKFLSLVTGPANDAQRKVAVETALEQSTPYKIDDLAYDTSVRGVFTHIAVVARSTLEEAEDFATENGFDPVCFIATSQGTKFISAPWFGPTQSAGTLLKEGETLERGIKPINLAKINATNGTEATSEAAEENRVDDDEARPAMVVAPVRQPQASVKPLLRGIKLPATTKFRTPDTAQLRNKAQQTAAVIKNQARNGLTATKGQLEKLRPLKPRGLRFASIAKKKTVTALHVVSGAIAGIFEKVRNSKLAKRPAMPDQLKRVSTIKWPLAAGVAALGLVGVIFATGVGNSDRDVTIATAEQLSPQVSAPASVDAGLETANTAAITETDLTHDFEAAALEEAPVSTELTAEDAAVLEALSDIFPEDKLQNLESTTDEMRITQASSIVDDERTAALAAAPNAAAPSPPVATPGILVADRDPPLADPDETQDMPALEAADEESAGLTEQVVVTDESATTEQITTADNLEPEGPTSEGVRSSDGHMVFSGPPPVVPPATPNRFVEGARTADLNRLSRVRPNERPESFAERFPESSAPNAAETDTDLLSSYRPRLRPADAPAAAPAEPEVPSPAEPQVSTQPEQNEAPVVALIAPSNPTLRPSTRPRNFSRIVARAERQRTRATTQAPAAQTAAAPAPAQRSVAPSAPSSSSVTQEATARNVLRMRRINLIGVAGSASNRRAIVRMPNGRFRNIEVGDRLDGGRVAAIGSDELRYVKGERNIVLKIPNR